MRFLEIGILLLLSSVAAGPHQVALATHQRSDSLLLMAPLVIVNSSSSDLTVDTVGPFGQALAGYSVMLNATGGNVVAVDPSPATFSLVDGRVYTLAVVNDPQCAFDHWADTGNMTRVRTISIENSVVVSAVLRCGVNKYPTATQSTTSSKSVAQTVTDVVASPAPSVLSLATLLALFASLVVLAMALLAAMVLKRRTSARYNHPMGA